MHLHCSHLPILALALCLSSALAQNPFVGNWKLNTASAKSMEQYSFMTCASAVNRGITCDSPGGARYTSTPNGTRYSTPLHQSGLCKKLGDRTLECTVIMPGVPPGSRTWKL